VSETDLSSKTVCLYRALIRLTDKEFFIRVCGSGLPDRWYIFVPNMPFLVHIERPWDEKGLVYFVAICYSYCHAGIFYGHSVFWCPYGIHTFHILVCCTKKNLATLAWFQKCYRKGSTRPDL
jgi:hypothetical protein